MAVDRGGLHYDIKVINNFSASLKKFREDLKSARAEAEKLKSASRNLLSPSEQRARQQSAKAEQRQRDRELREKVRNIERERKARARLLRDIRREQATNVRAANQEQQQLLRQNRQRLRAIRQEQRAQERLASVRTRGARAAVAANNAVATSTKRANAAGTRMLFTFRRLFGVLAAFTAARLAAQGVASLVRQMVEFNRVVETAELGIASLITASGGVRDALGNSVGAGKALALAQKEAAKQTALLRLEGLKTAATFEQLVDTFQIAIGPGLAAGLDLQQIRKFTVQVSQAAAAAGVAQNQLSEEIRSILSGTIQQRTTRLAAVLGITNEDIRRAKEAGRLMEFLQDRFQAFSTAGEVALGTFTALTSNAADALGQLLGAGGLEFFNSLKGLLKDTIDLFTDLDPAAQSIKPDPEAVKIVQALASGLERAVNEARRLAGAFGFNDIIDSAQAVGDIVGTAAEVTGQLIEGFVKGFSDALSILSELASVVSDVSDISLLEDGTLADVTRLVTLVGSLVLSISTAGAAAKVFQFAMSAGASSSLLASGALLAVAVSLGLAADKAKELATSSKSTELSWGQLLALTTLYYQRVQDVVNLIAHDFVESMRSAGRKIKTIITFQLNDVLASFNQRALEILSIFSDEYAEQLEKLKKIRAGNADEAERELAAEKENLDNLRQFGKELEAQSAERLSRGIEQVYKDPAAFGGIGDQAGQLAEGITSKIKEGIGALKGVITETLDEDVSKAAENQSRLNSLIESMGPLIQRNRETLEEQSDLLKTTKEEVEKATAALDLQRQSLGTSGALQKQITLTVESQARLTERQAKLRREEGNEVRALNGVLQERRAVEESVGKLSAEAQARIEKGALAVRRITALQSQRLGQLNNIKLLELEIRSVQEEDGDASFLQARLEKARQFLDLTDKQIKNFRDQAEILLGSDKEAELIKRKIELLGKERLARERIKEISLELEEIARREQSRTAVGLTQAAEAESAKLRAEITKAQASLGEGQAAGKSQALLQIEKTLRLQQLEKSNLLDTVNLERQRLDALVQQQQIRLAELNGRLDRPGTTDEARANTLSTIRQTEEAIAALKSQQADASALGALKLLEQNQTLEAVEAKLIRIANLSGENGFLAGFAQLAKDQLASLPTAFETTFNLIGRIGETFASSLSKLIVDAFDPTQEIDPVERIRQLMRQIAQVVINELIRIAVAKAILQVGVSIGGLFSSAGGAGGEGLVGTAGATRAAKGGIARSSFDGPMYFADGTSKVPTPNVVQPARPRGLPASDTVNAWLTPGEAVIKRRSAAAAGYDFMKLLNDGKLDIGALRAVAGLKSRARGSRSFSRRGPGYAAGGAIPAAAIGPSPAASGPSVAVVVPNEEHADRIFAQGRGAMMHVMRQNRAAFRSALGV